jgi:flagellar motor switch protein FliN/FliY
MAQEQPPASPEGVTPASEPSVPAPAEASAAPAPIETAAPAPVENAAAAPVEGASAPSEDMANVDQAAIDELLKQANFEDPSAMPTDPAAAAVAGAAAFDLPSFQQVMQDAQVSSIDLLRDVELNVKIELGRSRMLVEDVLKLGEGSVVELDKLAGDPVDVFVNDRLVARGEVLVLNDNFCVRVNEIVAGVKEEGV